MILERIAISLSTLILTLMLMPYMLPYTIITKILIYFENKRRGIIGEKRTMAILKEHGDTRTYEQVQVGDFMRHVQFMRMIPNDVHLSIIVGPQYNAMASTNYDERLQKNVITLYYCNMKDRAEFSIRNTIRHELVHVEQQRRCRLIHDGLYTTWRGVTKSNIDWYGGEEPATRDFLGRIIARISYLELPWEVEAYGFNKYFSPLKALYIIGAIKYEIAAYAAQKYVLPAQLRKEAKKKGKPVPVKQSYRIEGF